MSRTRSKKVEGIKPQRKRRRRRTRAQIHADLATAQRAVQSIFEDDAEQTYDALRERAASLASDVSARTVILKDRWTKDGAEIDKLNKLSIDIGE